jgi:Domain of unknown function (DUF222)/HNH endonuclease
MSLSTAIAQLASAAEACAREALTDASAASDTLLLDQQRQLAMSNRMIDVASSALAAEIAQRSRPELGYAGLAQKMGARTPEKLVQLVTGTSSPTARRLVHVGTMIATATAHEADPLVEVAEPWLAPVLRAVAAGRLSGEAVEVIRAGLGLPGETVTPDALATAALQLTELASGLTLELLAARAREFRDDLDVAGVAEREEQRRERRYLHLYPQRDGMTRISGLLDPESAAVVTNAIDAATSPRRGGPRFVDPESAKRAEDLVNDPRTTEQIAVDALVELVEIAVRAWDNGMLGIRRADVRLLVTERDLAAREGGHRAGVGFVQGQRASVSIATVERHACDGGYVPILFNDDGQSLNLGQTQRFHNARQRTAIAARDGGCLAPDCDRPPSWTEVHHINEYSLGGKTDLHDGVLLCRHHHRMTHNNAWRVTREGDRYWFIPPPDIDFRQTPIPLVSKNPAMRRLLASA